MDKDSRAIVHIATDEKFIDAAYDIYERAFPGLNKFLILHDEQENKNSHLSSDKNYHFIEIKNDIVVEDVLKSINTIDVVIFHSLTVEMAKIAIQLPVEKTK